MTFGVSFPFLSESSPIMSEQSHGRFRSLFQKKFFILALTPLNDQKLSVIGICPTACVLVNTCVITLQCVFLYTVVVVVVMHLYVCKGQARDFAQTYQSGCQKTAGVVLYRHSQYVRLYKFVLFISL